MEGTVTHIASVACRVDTAEGMFKCALRRRLAESDTGESKPLAVGDRVKLQPTGRGEGVITEVLPRRSKLSRVVPEDPWSEHVIVANVDQLLIVSSVARPPLRVGLIDRYVIAAQKEGLRPILCINKVDLARPGAEHEQVARLYGELGFPVLLTSAEDGTGVEALKDVLRDRSTALAGHSGTGKTSLINAVQPGLKLKVAPLRWKGMHCTSSVSLLKLEFGGYVVDTPGVREFQPWDIEQREVAQFFPEIWEISQRCAMPDCRHTHEPGCAVKDALERGELPELRYKSYVGIMESVDRWRAPRHTDVEDPRRQVARSKRRAGRRTLKQRARQWWEEDLEEP